MKKYIALLLTILLACMAVNGGFAEGMALQPSEDTVIELTQEEPASNPAKAATVDGNGSAAATGKELSGYLWKRMSSAAKRIGGLKKKLEVIGGTEWYSYQGKGIELYTLHGYGSKTAIINLTKKSDYTLHGVKIGMKEKKMLSAVKKLKRSKSRKSKKQKEYWFNMKKGGYPAVLYVQVKSGKVSSLSLYMQNFD